MLSYFYPSKVVWTSWLEENPPNNPFLKAYSSLWVYYQLKITAIYSHLRRGQ